MAAWLRTNCDDDPSTTYRHVSLCRLALGRWCLVFYPCLKGESQDPEFQQNISCILTRENLLIKGQSIQPSTPAVAFNQRMRLLRFVALTVSIVSAQQ